MLAVIKVRKKIMTWRATSGICSRMEVTFWSLLAGLLDRLESERSGFVPVVVYKNKWKIRCELED